MQRFLWWPLSLAAHCQWCIPRQYCNPKSKALLTLCYLQHLVKDADNLVCNSRRVNGRLWVQMQLKSFLELVLQALLLFKKSCLQSLSAQALFVTFLSILAQGKVVPRSCRCYCPIPAY